MATTREKDGGIKDPQDGALLSGPRALYVVFIDVVSMLTLSLKISQHLYKRFA